MIQRVIMTNDIEFGSSQILLKKGDIIEVEPHKSFENVFHVYINHIKTETDLLVNEPAIFEMLKKKVA